MNHKDFKNFQSIEIERSVQQEDSQVKLINLFILKKKQFIIMNKESMLYRTHEIKSHLLKKLKDPIECLFFHIRDANFPKFKEILEKYKISPECQDNEENTFLNLSVQCNSDAITKYLLNIGAEVNTLNVIYFYNTFRQNKIHHYIMHLYIKISK